MGWNHFDERGNARMVDVSEKAVTGRRAVAKGSIQVSEEVFHAIADKKVAKGDVLTVAQVAAIMGTKKTSDLIPMCHPLQLGKSEVTFELHPETMEIEAICTVQVDGRTGVEMEALTGVSTALLTIYDMCKGIDKQMTIKQIYLYEKTGGKSGAFKNESII